MIKRILVGLGGTSFTPSAIQRGIELAKHHDARLTGVTILDTRRLASVGATSIGGMHAAVELREHRLAVSHQRVEKAAEEFETACEEAGVDYLIDNEKGDAFEQMIALSRFHDLMIFGLRSVFDYGFGLEPPDILGQLIDCGVRPILAEAQQYRPIRNVLLSYSGSAESAKMIKRFMQMQLWPDVSFRLLTCECDETDSRRRLVDAADYLRSYGYEPELVHCNQPAREAILNEAAKSDIDLIAIGSSARNYLMRKIFGRNMFHVVQHADRPLFLAY